MSANHKISYESYSGKNLSFARTEISEYELRAHAELVRNEMAGRTVLYVPIGGSGIKHYNTLVKKQLEDAGVNVHSLPLHQADDTMGGYREIQTPDVITEGVVKNCRPDVLVLFEASAKDTGEGMTGAVVWALERISGVLAGIEKIYTSAMIDGLGIVNLPVLKDYQKYIGIYNFMREKMPETFHSLDQNHRWDYISDCVPPDDKYVVIPSALLETQQVQPVVFGLQDVRTQMFVDGIRTEIIQRAEAHPIIFWGVEVSGNSYARELANWFHANTRNEVLDAIVLPDRKMAGFDSRIAKDRYNVFVDDTKSGKNYKIIQKEVDHMWKEIRGADYAWANYKGELKPGILNLKSIPID